MPRPKRLSEIHKPDPYASLPPAQAEAMRALAGECRYITVGGGCKVVEVIGGRKHGEFGPAALKALAEAGKLEVVTLTVYQRVEK